MKCMVIGGAGFIGSNLVDRLIDDGHDVTIVDNLSTGKEENINSSAKFFNEDSTIFLLLTVSLTIAEEGMTALLGYR